MNGTQPHTGVKEAASVLRNKANRAESYNLFVAARSKGNSISASSGLAGISRMTGTRYELKRRSEEEHRQALESARGAIATKAETVGILSESLRKAEPQYIAPIAGALARIQGYEAPQRSQIEVRQIPASVMTWLDAIDAIDVNDEPALSLPETVPTKALVDKGSG